MTWDRVWGTRTRKRWILGVPESEPDSDLCPWAREIVSVIFWIVSDPSSSLDVPTERLVSTPPLPSPLAAAVEAVMALPPPPAIKVVIPECPPALSLVRQWVAGWTCANVEDEVVKEILEAKPVYRCWRRSQDPSLFTLSSMPFGFSQPGSSVAGEGHLYHTLIFTMFISVLRGITDQLSPAF